LTKSGIVPGVKPHLKTYTLPGTSGDTVMQGLDSLAARLQEYYTQGARFTKWRAPLEVDVKSGRPTRFAIEANMRDLARFALISQSEGLVPIVEPDLIMKVTLCLSHLYLTISHILSYIISSRPISSHLISYFISTHPISLHLISFHLTSNR
jgi:fructose-bisphosphate aldolase, class I